MNIKIDGESFTFDIRKKIDWMYAYLEDIIDVKDCCNIVSEYFGAVLFIVDKKQFKRFEIPLPSIGEVTSASFIKKFSMPYLYDELTRRYEIYPRTGEKIPCWCHDQSNWSNVDERQGDINNFIDWILVAFKLHRNAENWNNSCCGSDLLNHFLYSTGRGKFLVPGDDRTHEEVTEFVADLLEMAIYFKTYFYLKFGQRHCEKIVLSILDIIKWNIRCFSTDLFNLGEVICRYCIPNNNYMIQMK